MNTMATEVVFCANCSHQYVLSGSDECVAIGRPEKAIFVVLFLLVPVCTGALGKENESDKRYSFLSA